MRGVPRGHRGYPPSPPPQALPHIRIPALPASCSLHTTPPRLKVSPPPPPHPLTPPLGPPPPRPLVPVADAGRPGARGEGGQSRHLREGASAPLHRPPQGLAVPAHRYGPVRAWRGGGRTPTPPRPITCDPTRPIGNLDGERCAAQRAVEDSFVRRFLHGTFPGCLADEAVLKRRSNSLLVCLLLLRRLPPSKLCFLLGYAETLLSHLYKCPVRIEAQTVPDAAVYKYL